jgi:hypothetical protein
MKTKYLKAFIGTALDVVIKGTTNPVSPRPLSLQSLESWDNLWQAVRHLQRNENVDVIYWDENSTQVDRFKLGLINKIENKWDGEGVYAGRVYVSVEYQIGSLERRTVYIRRNFAERIQTPVERALKIQPCSTAYNTSKFILNMTHREGMPLYERSVTEWLRVIDEWSREKHSVGL